MEHNKLFLVNTQGESFVVEAPNMIEALRLFQSYALENYVEDEVEHVTPISDYPVIQA